MLCRHAIHGLVVAACFLVGTEQVSAGTFVFSDHDYPNANWFIPDMTDVVSAGQVLTGGNPGSYRQITMRSAEDGVFAANLNTTFHWNPSSQGAITKIVYNVDTKTFNGFGAVYYALLQQAGVLYIERSTLGQFVASGNGWFNSTNRTLNPADFADIPGLRLVGRK